MRSYVLKSRVFESFGPERDGSLAVATGRFGQTALHLVFAASQGAVLWPALRGF